jgi:UDP-3-O-[3-hydroxymyristoyl] glucosamine N-acyltransferase LpxD
METIKTSEITEFLSAKSLGNELDVDTPLPLVLAVNKSLTFVGDVKTFKLEFEKALKFDCAIIAPMGTFLPEQSKATLILVDNPRSSFGRVIKHFFTKPNRPGIASTAVVSPNAKIHESSSIGHYTVVGDGVVIGSNVEIRNHVVISSNVIIGDGCLIKSHAVIGEEGFGIEKDDNGNNFHIPHIGSVHIGNDSEIGSFTTVCSGTITPTKIGNFTMVDDHVHIAHNCKIGDNVVITACAEVSGSVEIEDNAWLGPNSSVLQGLTVGSKSTLGIGAVAVRSIPANEVRVGNPARPLLKQ